MVIATKGTVGKHLARVIGRPNRLIMDFEDTEIGKAPRKLSVDKQDIHEIRVGTYKSFARVVMDFQDRPVPAFKVRREKDSVAVVFGGSLAAELDEAKRAASRACCEKRLPRLILISCRRLPSPQGPTVSFSDHDRKEHPGFCRQGEPGWSCGSEPRSRRLATASAPAPGSMKMARTWIGRSHRRR